MLTDWSRLLITWRAAHFHAVAATDLAAVVAAAAVAAAAGGDGDGADPQQQLHGTAAGGGGGDAPHTDLASEAPAT